MAAPLCAVDTDVLVLLLSAEKDLNEDHRRRRGYAEQHVELLLKQKARFTVPSPVLTELTAKRPGAVVLDALADVLGSTRISPLNADAAIVAGEIISKSLASRKADIDRVRVKFDNLIAAVSHHVGAKYLLTGNPRDMSVALTAISSGVVVVDATEQPRGQGSLPFAT